jgi:hypothetical protein
MLSAPIGAERMLVYTGTGPAGKAANPAQAAELTNGTGAKLPPGPVTVYDAGEYAGDALLGFTEIGEKRFVSWGDDLSVTVSYDAQSSLRVDSVKIASGVMTLTRKLVSERVYTANNAGEASRLLVIEHPKTPGAALAEPAAAAEETSGLYRFRLELPAHKPARLTVREETPREEKVVIGSLDDRGLAAYISGSGTPANVKAALQKAAAVKAAAVKAAADCDAIKTKRQELAADEDRIRKNLEAAGGSSAQGQEYLSRLSKMDADIDALDARIEAADKAAKDAKAAFDAYLAALDL